MIVLAAVLLALLVAGLVWGARAGPGPVRNFSSRERRERAIETQATVEEHDIEEMIEARNEIRRRRGKPTIGEELGRRALDPDDES